MSHNDITRDRIASKPASTDYRNGYEAIWPSKPKPVELQQGDGVRDDEAREEK